MRTYLVKIGLGGWIQTIPRRNHSPEFQDSNFHTYLHALAEMWIRGRGNPARYLCSSDHASVRRRTLHNNTSRSRQSRTKISFLRWDGRWNNLPRAWAGESNSMVETWTCPIFSDSLYRINLSAELGSKLPEISSPPKNLKCSGKAN